MDSAFIRFKARVADVLGITALSADCLRFAGVHTCFLIFTNLHGVFINTLLFRLTGENTIILRYNFIYFLTYSVAMPLASLCMRKTSPRIASRVGILLYISMYLTFFGLMFSGKLAVGMPAIAILSACGGSAYWISYNVMLIDFSTVQNRDIAVSFLGMSSGAVALVMPMFSGYIISLFSGMIGYYVMFGASLLVAITTMVLSTLKIPPIPPKTHKTYYKLAISNIVKNRIWKYCMLCEYMKGLREGVFAFFLNLLLFSNVQNEALIGFNTLLSSVLIIAANWTIGKFMNPKHRIRWMLTATTVLFIASGLLFFKLDATTIIIMSITNAYFNIILLNPIVTVMFTLFNRTADGAKAKYELLACKELLLGLGRASGVLMVIFFPQTQLGYLIAMAILTGSQYITVFITSRTSKMVNALPEA